MSSEAWNQRYSEKEFVYGTEPNWFFRQELDKLAAGRILLPAEGEGRNAVYAAVSGWQVQAFDQSQAGRDKAFQLAGTSGVTIAYDIADLTDCNYPENSFDVVALVFVHTPSAVRYGIHRRLITFLKPGGTFILTGYTKEQLHYRTGGPGDPDMLLSEEILRSDFAGLDIQSIVQEIREVNEGKLHRGQASVISMAAVKQLV